MTQKERGLPHGLPAMEDDVAHVCLRHSRFPGEGHIVARYHTSVLGTTDAPLVSSLSLSLSISLFLSLPSFGSVLATPDPNTSPKVSRDKFGESLGGSHRGQKRHINIWHMHNFSVTPVTDPPGREPDSSRPGTRTKTFMFLGFRTQHINFWPLATGLETPPPPPGRETPPRPGSHRKNLFMFMCLFLSWESPRTSPEVSRTSPEVFGHFAGSSLTVELNSNPEVPRKFPRLPWKFPGSSEVSRFSGKPDTLFWLTKTFSEKVSRYKWEPYCDTNWWCIYYFLPRRGHTFAKVSR